MKTKSSLNQSAIQLAVCYSNNANLLKILIKKGANARAIDECHNSLLHLGLQYKCHPDIIFFLINYGLDVKGVNSFKMTPLHYAAQDYKNP